MSDQLASHDSFTLSLDGRSLNVLETMSDAFMLLDNQWYIAYVNPQAEPILQRSREELTGKNIWEVFPEGVGSPSYHKYQQSLKTLQPVQFVEFYRAIHKWIEARVFPSAEGLAIYFLDVTSHIQAQQELRLSEERLRLALSGTSVTIYQQDIQLRYTWIYNPLSAFSPETIIGKTDADFVLPDEARWLTEIKQQVLCSGKGIRTELGTTSVAGVHVHDLTVEPLYDSAGRIIGVTGVSVDITERKQMEATLRQNESLRRFILESMPQKIFTAKPNGEVDYFNQQWMEFTGLSFVQIKNWGWIQFIHPEDVEENINRWQHSIDTGEPFQFVHRFRRNDGVYIWHLSRALPMRDEDGKIVMWIGSNTDISEQRELEQRKDDFISMASHELRTPITTLKGLTQIIARKLERKGIDDFAANLATMDKQINRLTRLIAELLDVSKIQAGRLDYDEEPVDIDVLVHETIEMLQPSNPTHIFSITGATSATILGDQDRLSQVLTNLISNAVKYSPQATNVDIALAATDTTALIRVTDYGVGIPQIHQSKIFDRFYRVFDAHDSAFPGLGMGLYIACEIVHRHCGTLTVASEEGNGSTFTVSLPLK
ncbi:MAG TPA: PAS domain-containing sensor histidine kinase [Ktedonobacteraceae bacterium]|nr:PAS domain-containing sensor histidine kinase [Ktedonobacteraceae bacterium]